MSEILCNTYSIVARCRRTGELGVAIASAVPAVGSICVYLRSGVGAVSTQAWLNPYLALSVLDSMEAGNSTEAAVKAALASDPAAPVRQLGAIGLSGDGTAWTGSECTSWCGQKIGADYAIQGNMLTGPEVLEAMANSFVSSHPQSLDERLLGALEAGQGVGADKRGRQSAALAVIGAEDYRRVDLRVDEHPDPVVELRRVYEIAKKQLAPFVGGMPRKGRRPEAAPDQVTKMLLNSPPDRPGGGGSRIP